MLAFSSVYDAARVQINGRVFESVSRMIKNRSTTSYDSFDTYILRNMLMRLSVSRMPQGDLTCSGVLRYVLQYVVV